VTLLSRVRIRSDEEVQALEAAERQQAEARLQMSQFQHQDNGGYSADEEAADVLDEANAPKVGRNDPCPCGSGKKYKHCHGQLS